MEPTTNDHDPVNHPSHYTAHPSGIEAIEVVEHFPYNVGAAIKYLWRAGLKDDAPTEQDYRKAIWYIEREILRRAVLKDKEQEVTVTFKRDSDNQSIGKVVDPTLIHQVTDYIRVCMDNGDTLQEAGRKAQDVYGPDLRHYGGE